MSKKLSKPTIAFHWLTGLMFMSVLGLGLYLVDLPKTPEKFELLAIHKSIGLMVFAVALLRLIWRLKEGPISSVSELSKWQSILATSIHHLLLLATLAMPISGLMMNVGGGRNTNIFDIEIISAGEKIEWLSGLGHTIHVQAVNIILIALFLHVAGALKHQLIDKDGTLSRMLGRKF